MKKQIFSMMLLISTITIANAQTGNVGINTTTPAATLDVVGQPTNPTKLDGIIAPRLTGDELSAKNYTPIQTGALVYVTAAVVSPSTQTVNVTTSGYYYFNGTIWVKTSGSGGSSGTEPWFDQSTYAEATANTQNIYQMGNVAIGKTTGASSLDVLGSFRSGDLHAGTVGTYSSILGGNTNQATAVNSVILGGVNNISSGANAVAGGNNAQSLGYAAFAFGSNLVAGAAKQFSVGYFNAITSGSAPNVDVATDALFQVGNGSGPALRNNAVTILKNGNTGIGIAGAEAAAKPTEMLDIGSGNVRVRDINTNVGVGTTDRVVVADTNGVLKTVDFGSYTLFHARLTSSQNLAANTITSLLLAVPLATSPIYSYNTGTGVMTFNQAGNYLVTMQASFTNISAGTQLLMGIRPFPDAPYLGRGSHHNAITNSGGIGELMNYTTMIIVPSAGYQVRFVAVTSSSSTVLATETGGTGSGNVTNVTVQKI